MTQYLFKSRVHSSFVPATRMAPVAPDDATNLAERTARSLFVEVVGDLLVMDNRVVVVMLAVGVSQRHLIAVRRAPCAA